MKMSAKKYEMLREEYSGICTNCKEIAHGDTEPDAEDYECENCGERCVQGIENLLIMGEIEVEGLDVNEEGIVSTEEA